QIAQLREIARGAVRGVPPYLPRAIGGLPTHAQPPEELGVGHLADRSRPIDHRSSVGGAVLAREALAFAQAEAARPVRAAHGTFAGGLHLVEAEPARTRGDVRRAGADLERAMVDAAAAGHGRAQHADALTAVCGECARIRRIRANDTRYLLRRAREVERAPRRVELRRERHALGVLRPADELPSQMAWQLALEQLATHRRQALLELAAGLARVDLRLRLREDRAGVELKRSLHEGHAGLVIAREDRVRDRRGSTPARQERGVDVRRP